ncbi:MAG: AAA family ATPase, partial [Candidatus Contendobacter sp.]|nr:AAA family ATPase [Candidatus Contendobacter sp.]
RLISISNPPVRDVCNGQLSMAFKEQGKKKPGIERDTLYFNAFTEDLFHWDNDLAGDSQRHLKINSDSRFFLGFKELALEERIFAYLERYADFDFKIDYEHWTITFSRSDMDHIKISRGEENIFIWCIFLAICELTIDGAEAYDWVRFLYIDDPISSLDDNNAIAVASDLAQLLKRGRGRVKTVISTHHGLFFNVMCNELKKSPHSHKQYFLHRGSTPDSYTLQATDDTPFFHHVAMLSELQQAAQSGRLYTHHFNMLRGILEKTATFFGFDDFSACIHGVDDEVLYARALNLLSHGKYSVYEPREMVGDTKELFRRILNAFLDRYRFELPELTAQTTSSPNTP